MKSLSLTRPHAIIMVGIPGSGKSFFAEKFAQTFNAPFVSHHQLQAIIGTSDAKIAARLADSYINELTKTRHSIVVEGGADTRAERLALAKKLRALDYEPLFVWVQTDPTTAKTRAAKPKQSLASRQLKGDEHDQLMRRFTAPHVVKENVIVISGKHTYATQAKVVLKKLTGPRADISTHASPPTRSFSDVRRSK